MDWTPVINAILGYIIQALVIIIGSLGAFGIGKLLTIVYPYYKRLHDKDTLGIVDSLTDRAVEYAQQQLKGASGDAKRDFAVKAATDWLVARNIKVSPSEVIAQVQNGYNKLFPIFEAQQDYDEWKKEIESITNGKVVLPETPAPTNTSEASMSSSPEIVPISEGDGASPQ